MTLQDMATALAMEITVIKHVKVVTAKTRPVTRDYVPVSDTALAERVVN